MTIEIEFFGLTGPVGSGSNDILLLKHPPSTGLGGYDITVDPTDGPTQVLGVDFGVTHMDAQGFTAGLALDLEGSDIKSALEGDPDDLLKLRVLYNYEE